MDIVPGFTELRGLMDAKAGARAPALASPIDY
jgi:hypothetical protein